MTFAHPWFLSGLALIPILLLLYLKGRKNRRTLGYSDLSSLRLSGQSWRQHCIHLPLLLFLAGLTLLIISLARPQEGIEKTEQINHGIGIEIVVDRSGSMKAPVIYGGVEMTRLDAVKRAFSRFIFGDTPNHGGRPNDLVGIIAYSQFAETICPLTLAHDTLEDFIGLIRIPTEGDPLDDGSTAIGDALALAAARLHEAGSSDDGYKLKSKIIILLTDGVQTAGHYSPMQGARLAKEWDIKVYTIYIGDKPESAGFFRMGNRGAKAIKVLKNIAHETGGMFWQARSDRGDSSDTLHEITSAIDNLEKSEIESIRYLDYKEFYQRYLLTGLGCIVLGCILKWTILEVVR